MTLRSHRIRLLSAACAVAASLVAPVPARAQLGSAVAFAGTPDHGPELLVLRPAAAWGEATLLVYRRGRDGVWVRSESLRPVSPSAAYEGFLPSIAAAGGIAVAAAGDAEGAWAANVYERHGAGWRGLARVPVEPGAEPSPSDPAPLNMGRLMGIMQPPDRSVALDPSGRTMAVWRHGADAGLVRVLSRAGDSGPWAREAELPIGDGTDPAGVTLAATADRVVVGVPSHEPAGAVLTFVRRSPGTWALEAELRDTTLTAGAGLGSAVAVRDGWLAAGAPGAGLVATYRRDGEAWVAGPVLRPDRADPAADRFGHALALADPELWVGAPGARQGIGAVHRYEWAAEGWRAAEVLELADPPGGTDARGGGGPAAGEPSGFGWSIALTADVAAVGAPGTRQGRGRVVVLERDGSGWRPAQAIEERALPESIATGAEVGCADDTAAGFDCRAVDLLAYLSLESLGAEPDEMLSDVWGWTDPETGREYALVGRTAGMAVVDVSDPTAPVFLGLVPGNPAGPRDVKTYGQYAFFTGDGAGHHGLVVFDLTRLRGAPPPDGVYPPDARYTGIGSAHNLILETEGGVAIPVGASGSGTTCGGGFHMVDVSTPLEPRFLGCYTDDIGLIAPGRSHDGQCVVYRGPDARYRGRRICFASNETAIRVLDITDPAAVEEVAKASYPGAAYTHQGWLTEDHRYFFMNDELDELVGLTDRTRTLVWDVAELDDPVLVAEHLGPDGATDHNLFIRGNRMYQANYQAGMRVIDISDPHAPVEIGHFDTTPYDGNPPGFASGAWTAYPFLDSGTVVVSSMYEGLFLLRPRPVIP